MDGVFWFYRTNLVQLRERGYLLFQKASFFRMAGVSRITTKEIRYSALGGGLFFCGNRYIENV